MLTKYNFYVCNLILKQMSYDFFKTDKFTISKQILCSLNNFLCILLYFKDKKTDAT